MTTKKFYSLEDINEKDCRYNLVFGERSNGKTTAGLERILSRWIEHGEKGAYLRRYDIEIKGRRGEVIFDSIANERGLPEKWTKGEWTHIVYYRQAWYLAKYDEKKNGFKKQKEPFCYAFAMNQGMHDKGGSYSTITTVVLDEFLTRDRYLVDEFAKFQNMISTIIRHRDNVKIYMFANTVSKWNPYFEAMGLRHAKTMKKGSIDVYKFGEEEKLKVAVEYTDSADKNGGKASDVYFAFDNPKIKMITTGEWEIDIYPHCPVKFDQRDILTNIFIMFDGSIVQGDIVEKEDSAFIFFHIKTTPMKNYDDESGTVYDDVQVYSMKHNPRYNHASRIFGTPRNKVAHVVKDLFSKDLVFYQNNEIGEIVRAYILESETNDPTNVKS